MNIHRRVLAVILTGTLALAACGGDDDADTAPTTTTVPDDLSDESGGESSDEQGPSSTDVPSDDPVPTIAPDLPDEFLEGAGPVAIVGDSLPEFPRDPGEVDEAVGETAPVLIGETLDGESIRIDAAVDGPTWLVFVAHWCPHCNEEIPVINELRDEGRIPDEVNVVAISTAYNPGRPNWPPDEWLDEMDWTYPAVNDGIDTDQEIYIAATAFGLGGFPFSILIDEDGVVDTRWSGTHDPDEMVAQLNDLVAN